MIKKFPVDWKTIGSIGFLVLLVASIAVITRYLPQQRGTQPRAAETKAFNSLPSDGRIQYTKSTYPPDPTGTCQFDSAADWLEVGQFYFSIPEYDSVRSYVAFDTSAIPSGAVITSVTLKLTRKGGSTSGSNFYIRVRNYNWGGSLGCSDWGSGSDTPDTYYTGNLPGFGQSFNILLSPSKVTKAGITYLSLVSDREEDPVKPGSSTENVIIYSANSSLPPQLTVGYTVPGPPTPSCGSNGCESGETCSSCPADCGLCSPSPPQPPKPPKPPGPQPPKPSGTLTSLQLTLSVTYLVGNMKVPVKIGSFSKEVEVSPDKKDYSLDVKEANISLGNPISVVVGGNKTLIKKIQVTPSTETTAVNVGDLTLGDITGDNKIDDKDAVSFLDSITKQTLKGDLNADTVTNSLDWSILLANFSKVGDL